MSLGSLAFALGVVGFTLFAFVVAGFIRGLLVYSGSHKWSLGSYRVVGFTRFRPCCRKVLPGSLEFALGSLGSLRFALEVVGNIQSRFVHLCSPLASSGSSGVIRFTRVRPGGSWAHPGSLCSLRFALRAGVWSSSFVGFAPVRLGCCWVHPELLGSLELDLGVVGFIRGRWVHSC